MKTSGLLLVGFILVGVAWLGRSQLCLFLGLVLLAAAAMHGANER